MPWAEILKWREDKHLFALVVSSTDFQIWPKCSLTDSQIQDIRRVSTTVSV